MEVWANNNPDIYINRSNLNSAESTFNEVSRSGKAIYYTHKTTPSPFRNGDFWVEPMEGLHIQMEWKPKAILKDYDTIAQYYAACLLHVLDLMGYLNEDIVRDVKRMLKLSPRQEAIIWAN